MITRATPAIDPTAAAVLQPMLEPDEVIVWAERPSLSRMLVSGLRESLLAPLTLLVLAAIGVILALRAAGFQMNIPFDEPLFVVLAVAFVSLPFCRPLCGLLYAAPFFTPLAYGATRSYFVVCRGLVFRRLTRTPVSTVERIILAPYAGRRVPVFQMRGDQKAEFSFLHVTHPETTQAAIERLIWPPEALA